MDIKPETMLTVAAVGALAYTCMNKKKEAAPVAPSVVGGSKGKSEIRRRRLLKIKNRSKQKRSSKPKRRSKPKRSSKPKRRSKPKRSARKSKPKRSARKSKPRRRSVRKSKPKRNTQSRSSKKRTSSRLTVPQLREKLKALGKNPFGSRQTLIDRLHGKETSKQSRGSSQSRSASSAPKESVEKMTVPKMRFLLRKKGKSEEGDRKELENRLRPLL